ncbi:MAG TPA: hypothetical protein VF200_00840 [Woeseiaceae bacterium]
MSQWGIATLIVFAVTGVVAWWLRGYVAAAAARALRERIEDLESRLADERRELEALRADHARLAERLRSETAQRAAAEASPAQEPERRRTRS